METTEVKPDFDGFRFAAWIDPVTSDDIGYFEFYSSAMEATKESPGSYIFKVSFKKLGKFEVKETLVEVK